MGEWGGRWLTLWGSILCEQDGRGGLALGFWGERGGGWARVGGGCLMLGGGCGNGGKLALRPVYNGPVGALVPSSPDGGACERWSGS